jgi:hypothetical protein
MSDEANVWRPQLVGRTWADQVDVKDDAGHFTNVNAETVLEELAETRTHAVDSILALISTPTSEPVFVKGFYAGSYSGGGHYTWNATTNKNTANGGTIIDPTTTGGFDGTPSTTVAYFTAQGTGVGLGCWILNYSQNITVLHYGAVGLNTAVDTNAFVKALTNHENVFAPELSGGDAYYISNLDISRGDAVLYGDTGTYLQLDSTTGTEAIIISGDFAKLRTLTVIGTDNTVDAVKTTGFRNKLENVVVTGISKNALRAVGLETIVNYGKYKGGIVAGISVENADLHLVDVYITENYDGLRSVGVGAITGFHIHSSLNTRYGFYLSGASASQLHACYADTNGDTGWLIRDTTTSMVLVDCWGYKSSNLGAGHHDFQFLNAKNVKLVGCRSNGTGGFAKTSSYSVDTNSRVDFISCDAEIAPVGFASGNVTVIGGSRELAKYNRATDVFQTDYKSIANTAADTLTCDTTIDGDISTAGFVAFEVNLLYRDTGGVTIGTERKIINIGIGGPTTNVLSVFGAGLAITAPVLSLGANTLYNLVFTVTNTLGYTVQVTANVKFLGTGRGFI